VFSLNAHRQPLSFFTPSHFHGYSRSFRFCPIWIDLRNPMLHAFLLCAEMGEEKIGEIEVADGEI